MVPFQSEVSMPCSELDLSLGASALLVDLYNSVKNGIITKHELGM
jgi:hypothetical protein